MVRAIPRRRLQLDLHNDDRLCVPATLDGTDYEPTIVCTMGLRAGQLALPFVLTIASLVVNRRRSHEPLHLGVPYFRGER